MAIQFACPGCLQPIEVDDEIAGKTAACPYCQRVVNVPSESTYDEVAHADARPIGSPGATVGSGRPASSADPSRYLPQTPPEPYSPGGLHIGPPPDARLRSARLFGNVALGCALLAGLCFGSGSILVAKTFTEVFGDNPIVGIPTSQQQQELMASPSFPRASLLACASMPLGAAALVISIISLRRKSRGNWRAWSALLMSSGILGVFILGFLNFLIGGFGAAL